MPRYLMDVNLPYYFSLWRGEQYIHQKDIDDELVALSMDNKRSHYGWVAGP